MEQKPLNKSNIILNEPIYIIWYPENKEFHNRLIKVTQFKNDLIYLEEIKTNIIIFFLAESLKKGRIKQINKEK